MKKMAIVLSVLTLVAGIAFAKSAYKFHYKVSATCSTCGAKTISEFDADYDHQARSKAKELVTHNLLPNGGKCGGRNPHITIISKDVND